MANQEITAAPIQALSDGGYLLTLTDGDLPDFQRLPVAEIAAAAALAETAVQPGELGAGAYLETTDVVRLSDHNALVAALQAKIDALAAQLDILTNLVGVGTIQTFENDVYETGVFF